MAKALRQGAQVAEWSHVHCEGGTTMNVGKHPNDGCSRPFADALQSPERGSPTSFILKGNTEMQRATEVQ